MDRTIIINDMTFKASNVVINSIAKNKSELIRISFDFKVTHETYHDVTVLLYENDFTVKVPEENLTFHAVISNYSTSITNLYEEGAIGDFKLELTEKE